MAKSANDNMMTIDFS